MLVVLAIEAVNREKLKILAKVGSIYGGLLKIIQHTLPHVSPLERHDGVPQDEGSLSR